MPGLLIKDLPKDIHSRLKARAAANRRSLSSEAIVILETALEERSGPMTLDEIDKARLRGRRPLTDAILSRARRRER